MIMDVKQWSQRMHERSDMVTRLAHLTRGRSDEEAFETLWKILNDKKLIANDLKGINIGKSKVCCFQEIPLLSIAENLQYEDSINCNGVRYSPFGIRILKGTFFQNGGRPVVYGNTEELKNCVPPCEYWRLVKMDLSDTSNLVDWSHEREWRINKDYPFEYAEIEILVATPEYYRKLVQKCIAENKEDILSKTNGIIVLNSLYN